MEMKNNITQSTWLALTRMVLGMLLIWKGLLFIQDTSELQMAIQQAAAAEYGGFGHVTAAVVSILTLVSGIFIMVGIFTKITSYVQIAMIIPAIIFIYSTGIERTSFEMISTIIILLLLVFYAKRGSGPISFDRSIRKYNSAVIEK
jgi:uncharacterized membrane protein YphA (DoxX/SURF4 family)